LKKDKTMKRYFFLLLPALFYTVLATAQLDRSVRPQPGPAPLIQLGDFETFTLDNGLKVIVVENRKVPVLSFQLTLDVDPVMEGDAKGYVNLAGSLLRDGTTNRSKEEIDEAIDFIGASLNTYSTGIFASSLTKHKETLLELMADVLLNPSFPESELQRSITQNISGLATVRTDPGAMVRNVSTRLVYGPDHPFGEVTTEESLSNVTLDMIKQYYATYFKPNVAYMVIVGDTDAKEARKMMNKYFGNWKQETVPEHTYETPQAPESNRVAFVDRLGAIQSNLSITYPVELPPGHEDAIKVSVMNNILGGGVFSGRLMQNLREDKGYTYGARSNLSTNPLVSRFSAGAEIRNSVTDSTVVEIFYEMHRLRNEPVDEETLQLIKNFMTGSFARSLESPRTMANFALNISRYDLPEDYYVTYLERLNQVTVEDVQLMAQKYLKPERAYIVVAGNKEEVAPNLERFTNVEVEFYDAFGKQIVASEAAAVPDDVSVDVVLENYLKAIGGSENLGKVTDMTITMKTEMMGQQVNITGYRKSPDLFLMETEMGGMVISKQLFNGEKAIVSSPMGQQEFTEGTEFEMMKSQAVMHPELHYKEMGTTKTLVGIEKMEELQVYKVEVVTSGNMKSFEYYGVDSGLKFKEETMQGEVFYDDYKEVDGLLFAHSIKQQMGPQMIEINIEEIKLNTGLDDSIFTIE
jgi:zinc protease